VQSIQRMLFPNKLYNNHKFTFHSLIVKENY